MKLFGLTLGQLGTVLLLAGCIAFIYTFAAMPHPVEVSKQIITPVPTPPPVVITSQPTPVSTTRICNNATNTTAINTFNTWNVLPILIVGIGILVAFYVLSVVIGSVEFAIQTASSCICP